MPDIQEVATNLMKAWEEHKSYVEREVKEIKANSGSAPETKEALARLNDRIDDLQAKISNPHRDTTAAEPDEHIKTFVSWMRGKVSDEALGNVQRKAMSVGSDPDGGYFVPASMSANITRKVHETSPMRQWATVETISTDMFEEMVDLDEVTSGWVSETGTRVETTTPQLDKLRIPVEEQYAMPKITTKLLEDADRDVAAWLEQKIADKFARTENNTFFVGNGVGKPRGLTTYPTAATADGSRAWGTFEHIATGNNGDFPATNPGDTLFDTIYSLKAAYRQGAIWMAPRLVYAKIRKIKNADVGYLWQPSLTEGQPARLLGYPAVEAEDMPALAAGSLSLAFGNFRLGYRVVDRRGIAVLRDPFTTKGYVIFYATKRVGGAAAHFESIKFVKFGS